MSTAPVTPNNLVGLNGGPRGSKAPSNPVNGERFAQALGAASAPRATTNEAKSVERSEAVKPRAEGRSEQKDPSANARTDGAVKGASAKDAADETGQADAPAAGEEVAVDQPAEGATGATTAAASLLTAIAESVDETAVPAEGANGEDASNPGLVANGLGASTPIIATVSAPAVLTGSTSPAPSLIDTELAAIATTITPGIGDDVANPLATPANGALPVVVDAETLLPEDGLTTALNVGLAQAADTKTTEGSIELLAPSNNASASAIAGPVLDPKATAISDAAAAKAALDSLANNARASDPTQSAAAATKLVSSAMESEPYRQVVNIVAPLKHMADGDYTMTLKLHPAHLGSVEITVALASGQINMSMNSDNPASRQMLRDSMNDLRTTLEQSGLNAGSLDVRSGDSQAQQNSSSENGPRGSFGNGGDEIEEVSHLARFTANVAATAVTDGPLDVRV